jgi:hypothetical protein
VVVKIQTRVVIVLGLVLLFLTTACVPVKPPVVTPPQFRAVSVVVQDPAGRAISGVEAKLDGTPPTVCTTNQDGYCLWPKVGTGLRDSQLWITADGYLPFYRHEILPAGNTPLPVAVLIPIPPPVPVPLLEPVQAVRTHFETASGLWRWRGMTAFRLYARWLAGEDVSGFLAAAKTAEVNVLRVLGMKAVMSNKPTEWRLDPAEIGERYYTQLPVFIRWLADQGFYCEFVVFADAQIIMPGEAAQKIHLARVAQALSGLPTAFLEIANEPFKNGVDPTGIYHASDNLGLLRASGLYDFPDINTPPFTLEYGTDHPGRDNEWPRKSREGQELQAATKRPFVVDEPMGVGPDQPGARSLNADDHFDSAAVGVLYSAGYTIHGDWGIQAVVPSPEVAAVIAVHPQVWHLLSVETILGQYTRGGLSDCPLQHSDALALRTFCSLSGATAWCVVVRPATTWTAIAVAPWTIAEQRGSRRNIVRLTR